jgi:hypothetical protein
MWEKELFINMGVILKSKYLYSFKYKYLLILNLVVW